jgi:hypothetical protein
MDVSSASNFFVGSLLYGMGIIVCCVVVVLVNNLFARFWQPIQVLKFNDYPPKENGWIDLDCRR